MRDILHSASQEKEGEALSATTQRQHGKPPVEKSASVNGHNLRLDQP